MSDRTRSLTIPPKVRKMKMRYKLSNGLLILGLILCFAVTMHASALLGVVYGSIHEAKQYAHRASFFIGNSDIIDEGESEFVPFDRAKLDVREVARIASSEAADYSLLIPLYVGNGLNPSFVEVWFSDNKERRKMLTGRLDYSGATKYSGAVWVGEFWKPYIQECGDERVIEIGGVSFEVVGVYDDSASGGMGETVNLLFSSCNDEAVAMINQEFNEVHSKRLMELIAHTDASNEIPSVDVLSGRLSEISLDIIPADHYYDADAETEVYRRFVFAVNVLLYVFSAVNIILITNFFVVNRYRELVIRKIHGCRTRGLIRLIVGDLVRDEAIAMLCVVPVEIGLSIAGSPLSVSLDNFLLTVAVFVGSMALFSLLIIGRFLVYYSGISLAGAVKE